MHPSLRSGAPSISHLYTSLGGVRGGGSRISSGLPQQSNWMVPAVICIFLRVSQCRHRASLRRLCGHTSLWSLWRWSHIQNFAIFHQFNFYPQQHIRSTILEPEFFLGGPHNWLPAFTSSILSTPSSYKHLLWLKTIPKPRPPAPVKEIFRYNLGLAWSIMVHPPLNDSLFWFCSLPKGII